MTNNAAGNDEWIGVDDISITGSAALPNLTINDVSLNEGNAGTTSFTFTVSLSAPAGPGGVTFDIATADGAAVAPGDYTAKTLTSQTIPAGSSTYTFDVLVNGDTLYENNENFWVYVTFVTGANVTDGVGLGSITNDDTAPDLTIGDAASSAEGNSGTTAVTFTVSLSTPSGAAVTFDIATADGTAVAPGDYVARSLTSQTIPAGSTSYTFDVLVNGDTTPENNDEFVVNVSSVTGANVTDGQGSHFIMNDDFPTLSIDDITQSEGDSGDTYFAFTVSLSELAPWPVYFDITTTDGTATTADGDYASHSINDHFITAGNLTAAFTVTVNGDTKVENNEAFTVDITDVNGATLGDGQGVGTIVNDDHIVVSINNVSQPELNSGTSVFPFVVTLDKPAGPGGITFDIHTLDGSATTADNDYVAKSETSVTIAEGDTTYNFDVTVNGDTTPEPDQTFMVEASNITGAGTGKSFWPRGTGTIQNDDSVNVSIDNVNHNEGNSGTTTYTFTVSLSQPAPAGGVNFDIATSDGSATTADSDYASASAIGVNIPAGSQTYTFDVTVNGDTKLENEEEFYVNVTNVSGTGVLLTDGLGVGTIVNDDIINLSINDVSQAELNSGALSPFTFTISLSGPAGAGGVSFDLATADGTATVADSDYYDETTPPLHYTISAGDTSATFNATVRGDDKVENDETFFVNLTNITGLGVHVADNQGLGTIQNDDSTTLTITGVTDTEGNAGTKTFSFNVHLSVAAGPGGVTFNIATVDGTATTADNDYVARSETGVNIPEGSQDYTFDVTVNGDTKVEDNEAFTVEVSGITGATKTPSLKTATGTITNDDSVNLTVNDVSHSEGNSGTTTYTFTVSLSGPAGPGGVLFDIGTFDGTATVADLDYGAVSATDISIPAGSTSNTFDVTVNGDTKGEADETFTVVVSNVRGSSVNLTDDTGLGTIVNDDFDVVISQVYGGGGNSGAYYKNDFIELFNHGSAAVNLNGWSVQYQSSGGTGNWTGLTALTNFNLQPGQYYLVQEAAGTGGTANLPTPDATGTIAMSGTAGKVALSRTVAVLNGCMTTTPNPNVIDLVGFGAANCSETSPTPVLSNTTSATRNDGGCTDTNNNLADFTVGALDATHGMPRNSSYTINPCHGVTMAISDVAVVEGDSGTINAHFVVALSDPAPAGGVTFNIDTADGTATTADNDYVGVHLTGQTIAAGATEYTLDVVVNGDVNVEPDETFSVVISSVVGTDVYLVDGTGTGTILTDDTVFLTINDVSVIEGNSRSTRATATFTVTLSAPAKPGGVTFDIATADNTATVADNDYVAKTLTGQSIPAGSTTYTFDVLINGDTTDEANETYFVNITNASGTGLVVSDAQGLGTIVNDDMAFTNIHDIQGPGSTSPLTVGNPYTTRGIVTARKWDGFYLQNPSGWYDANPNTSEGLYIYTNTAPPPTVVVGTDTVVTGTLSEYIPDGEPAGYPPLTELGGTLTILPLVAGIPLPAPAPITAADTSASGAFDQLERFEGMRVTIGALAVIAPTGGNYTETSAAATSNGTFYGVIDGINRPFREPGIQAPAAIPNPPCCIPRFDANPERLRVNSRGLDGTTGVDVTTGTLLYNLTGPLDYAYLTWNILPEAGFTMSPPAAPVPVSVPAPDEVTVGSFNMKRFYNSSDDSTCSEVILNPTAYNLRLTKVSLAIRNFLRLPDIIGVQEVENLATLTDIANQVNADVVAGGGTSPGYVAYLEEGNDQGCIDVGFLVKNTVTVTSVTQYGKDTLFYWDASLLNDRPPLALVGSVQPPTGDPFPLTVVVVHQRSLSGVDDPVDGARVRAKRQAQAEYLAELLQTLQTADPDTLLICVGDYNAYQFNDGYVDVMSTVRGAPTPADQVLINVSSDLVDPDLLDLEAMMPASEQYSFTFDGNAQTLDHAVTNQNLRNQFRRLEAARINADFPNIYSGDVNNALRVSDHDPVVAYFSWYTQVRGDLNGDGQMTRLDLKLMIEYFLGNDYLAPGVNADVNFDGVVDSTDLTWMFNELVGNNPMRD